MKTGYAPHGDPAAKPDGREKATSCPLAAHDAMLERTELDGDALQAWFGFEEAALRRGADTSLSRGDLAAAAADRFGRWTPSRPKGRRVAPTAAAEAA